MEVKEHSVKLAEGISKNSYKLNSVRPDTGSSQTDEMNRTNAVDVSCLKSKAKRLVPKPTGFLGKSDAISSRRKIIQVKESEFSKLTCTLENLGRQEGTIEVSLPSEVRQASISELSCLENCSIGSELIDMSNKVSNMKHVDDMCKKFLSFDELENIESNMRSSSDISAVEDCLAIDSLSTNEDIQQNKCTSEKMCRQSYYGKKFEFITIIKFF